MCGPLLILTKVTFENTTFGHYVGRAAALKRRQTGIFPNASERLDRPSIALGTMPCKPPGSRF
jgi:hypothetical protein